MNKALTSLKTASASAKRSPDDGADSEMPASKRARPEAAEDAANTPTPATAPWLYAAADTTPATPQSLESTAAAVPLLEVPADTPTAAIAPWLYSEN